MIVIPPDQLPAETLQGLLEEFATRDGTDYGTEEVSLADKVNQLRAQLSRKQVLIVYDVGQEQANLMTQQAYQERVQAMGDYPAED
jgi:uncharacterized protein